VYVQYLYASNCRQFKKTKPQQNHTHPEPGKIAGHPGCHGPLEAGDTVLGYHHPPYSLATMHLLLFNPREAVWFCFFRFFLVPKLAR
jgi:hypothetical protein